MPKTILFYATQANSREGAQHMGSSRNWERHLTSQHAHKLLKFQPSNLTVLTLDKF